MKIILILIGVFKSWSKLATAKQPAAQKGLPASSSNLIVKTKNTIIIIIFTATITIHDNHQFCHHFYNHHSYQQYENNFNQKMPQSREKYSMFNFSEIKKDKTEHPCFKVSGVGFKNTEES